ncbi:MAG: D-aminoacyl-tRNA deacylase [Marinobacter sp.]|uniref:D-aminoacyl-tRNA deacylase n=1 Tax=Marinobacter sp. TaxID=50741 RepID=UPI0034A041CE
MKGLIQRVTSASVVVEGKTIATINTGLLLFLGVEKTDTKNHADELCKKVLNYRVFSDEHTRMNLSLMDVGGDLLVVPQFTLAADTRSGSRPGFSFAAPPAEANDIFTHFIGLVVATIGEGRVATGKFGANMQVALINDGPVTFLLES